MIDLTTKTIINFLPFESSVKLDLLEKFDSLSQPEQAEISDLVWGIYYDLYETKVRENFNKGIAEAEKNGTEPDKTFYGKVLEETNKEMLAKLSSSEDSVDLSEARASMEKIIREINAAKASKTKN